MLIKRSDRIAAKSRLASVYQGLSSGGLDRRAFLRNAGLGATGLAALGAMPLSVARRAEAGPMNHAAPVQRIKNICTHCSVGCTVIAEVHNGVWVGQEPAWESPINRGTHCAKGASVRELVHGDRRLRYPMKLAGGRWQRISWQQALDEIADRMMAIRATSGPESVYFLGSAKFSNERRVSLPQAGRLLGHEQRRPPGAHLPLHHRGGGGQHVGLWRADQLLQRHPQRQDGAVHRQQRRRSASGVAAAHPFRQRRRTAPM